MYPQKYTNYKVIYPNQQDRCLFAPFILGGIAGTALGYGIANNNQNNNQCYAIYSVPYYQYPYYYCPCYNKKYY